mmetsp:Transcript_1511/g.2715  ORF Transcript_1511/g.2715 Transcript_1511/m.2715 type:complete len:101 (-) Transcript_1511:59-361(-)|eukprot:CAMPEP_0182445158 /NCGR_PEP_ID=MMETSP1172-20130603/3388_1 /TAXON_ID=708627 /ORGANISM="Timspurckia oligopyrenoides, Strain CCMP3278" /LENGTH=100 /DNA_ID=CAMNT_0024640877 /DNA_START=255 /DNA_END=557 /DNA_ORIENTATION=-
MKIEGVNVIGGEVEVVMNMSGKEWIGRGRVVETGDEPRRRFRRSHAPSRRPAEDSGSTLISRKSTKDCLNSAASSYRERSSVGVSRKSSLADSFADQCRC